MYFAEREPDDGHLAHRFTCGAGRLLNYSPIWECLLFSVISNKEDPREAQFGRPADSSPSPETPAAPELAIALPEYGQFWRVFGPLDVKSLEVKPHHLAFVASLAAKGPALFNNWLVIRLAMPSIGSCGNSESLAAIIALTSVLAMFDLGVGTTLVNTAAAKAASTDNTRAEASRCIELDARLLRRRRGAATGDRVGRSGFRPRGESILVSARRGRLTQVVRSWACAAYAAVFFSRRTQSQKLFAGLQLIWLGYGLSFLLARCSRR